MKLLIELELLFQLHLEVLELHFRGLPTPDGHTDFLGGTILPKMCVPTSS